MVGKENILYASFDQVPSFKGASTHILSTCRDSYRFDKHTTLYSLGEQVLPESKYFKHIPVNIKEKNYLRRAQKFQDRLSQYLANNQFRFGHFRGPFEGEVLLKAGLESIYEVNSVPSFELPYLYGRLPESVHFKLMEMEQYCLDKSSEVICPSAKIKEFLLNRYNNIDSQKISVIENGCDISELNSLNYEGGTLRLVYIGTLHPWQGLTWLLKVLRDYPLDITLDIYPSALKKWSKDLFRLIRKYELSDRVFVKDSLHKGQIHGVLSKYHYGIAPLIRMRRNTIQGCCPVKIKEYLAVGLPVIAPEMEVVTQIIENQKSGMLYQAGKINSLGELLELLLGNKDLHKKIAGFNRAEKQRVFSWDDYNQKLYSLPIFQA